MSSVVYVVVSLYMSFFRLYHLRRHMSLCHLCRFLGFFGFMCHLCRFLSLFVSYFVSISVVLCLCVVLYVDICRFLCHLCRSFVLSFFRISLFHVIICRFMCRSLSFICSLCRCYLSFFHMSLCRSMSLCVILRHMLFCFVV